MSSEPASIVFSLQSKLILAFVGVVMVALVIAGSIFVLVRRGELEQQELDQVIAASPAIYAVFSVLEERRASPEVLHEFVDSAAEGFDVRVLLVDRHDLSVVADSGDSLTGEQLELPLDALVSQERRGRQPYVSWEPHRGSPGSDLILVSAAVGRRLSPFTPSPDERYQLLLAVPQGTIRDAWQGLLPALGVAALIAASAIGVSRTRVDPNSAINPSVARNVSPTRPTSSPRMNTRSSRSISSWSARATVSK